MIQWLCEKRRKQKRTPEMSPKLIGIFKKQIKKSNSQPSVDLLRNDHTVALQRCGPSLSHYLMMIAMKAKDTNHNLE